MSTQGRGKQQAACCGGAAVRLQNKVRDPLCGRLVDGNSPFKLEREGSVHQFCGETCRDDYARALAGEPTPGVVFECAMHPEFRQAVPGDCPVCGMAMAPVRKPAEDAAGQGAGILGRVRAVLGM